MTKAEREMIVVATGALNDSVYCVAHHGAILRLRSRNTTIADQIATNYRRATVSPRERAMLDFAVKVASESHAIDHADFKRLTEHGFSDEDIWDIGAITAFFSYGSRMANLIDMRPNDEFYALGRARAREDAAFVSEHRVLGRRVAGLPAAAYPALAVNAIIVLGTPSDRAAHEAGSGNPAIRPHRTRYGGIRCPSRESSTARGGGERPGGERADPDPRRRR